LIETDAPYLTPQIIRNQINQPANVKYIYEYIANILNIDINHLQYQIEENFNKFFSTNN
jgi:TatD DNase family protein